MTSRITTIHDAWITKIESVLTDHARIPNPYDAEENSRLFLNKGYGLGLGPAINTNRVVGCKMSVERDFFVVLVRRITATEQNASAQSAITKTLLEDHFSLIQAIESDPTIGGAATKAVYTSDDGIGFLQASESGGKFYSIQTTFLTEYFEDLL